MRSWRRRFLSLHVVTISPFSPPHPHPSIPICAIKSTTWTLSLRSCDSLWEEVRQLCSAEFKPTYASWSERDWPKSPWRLLPSWRPFKVMSSFQGLGGNSKDCWERPKCKLEPKNPVLAWQGELRQAMPSISPAGAGAHSPSQPQGIKADWSKSVITPPLSWWLA